MATHSDITDGEIDVDSPLTTSLATKWRDNLIAQQEGDATAPGQSVKGLLIGGSGRTTDPGAVPTGGGEHSYAALTDTTGASIGYITVIRVTGDVDLSGSTITVDRNDLSAAHTTLARNIRSIVAEAGLNAAGVDTVGDPYGTLPNLERYAMPALAAAGNGGNTYISSTYAGGGGSAYGAGGDPSGSSGSSGTAAGGEAGGSLVILCDGDVDISNATITATGGAGATDSSAAGGGGGGGSVYIVAGGTLTISSVTIDCDGGAGGNAATDGGGGGGGFIYLAGTTVTGTATDLSVAGGSGPGGATDGAAGLATTETLTLDLIRAINEYR
jgi:hypothetical protein